MKVEYDPDADALYIYLRDGEVETTDEQDGGLLFDLDAKGQVLGIEILNASSQVSRPDAIEFAVVKEGRLDLDMDGPIPTPGVLK